ARAAAAGVPVLPPPLKDRLWGAKACINQCEACICAPQTVLIQACSAQGTASQSAHTTNWRLHDRSGQFAVRLVDAPHPSHSPMTAVWSEKSTEPRLSNTYSEPSHSPSSPYCSP